MYETLKNIVKRILPESAMNKHGQKIRNIYSSYYKGNKHQCNLCQAKLRKFIELKNNDLLCPSCGSLPRTRGLWKVINDKLINKTVLHFSPPLALKNIIKQKGQTKKYITSDFEGEFVTDLQLNIENIDLPTESIDIVICYHVLEHIENDAKAIAELYRILNNQGSCYIQTPFKEGNIAEDKSITEPLERLKYYGQKDHVRIYSVDGLKERLNKAGFETETIQIINEKDNYFGLKSKDIILKSKKHSLSKSEQTKND